LQKPLQLSVASRIVCGIHGLVVLEEELGAFLLGQILENHLGVIRILVLNRLSGHVSKLTPRPPDIGRPAQAAWAGGGP